MGISRRLEDICRSLALPTEQVLEFLANAENAQKINGLVEDFSAALMEYQVCKLNCLSYPMSDV